MTFLLIYRKIYSDYIWPVPDQSHAIETELSCHRNPGRRENNVCRDDGPEIRARARAGQPIDR